MPSFVFKIFSRIVVAFGWRIAAFRAGLRDRIYNLLGSFGGSAFINLRWPWPLCKPYQRRQLMLRPPGVGIGDNLMCTPIFREIKRKNPNCKITFLTRHPELFHNNPNLDNIVADSPEFAGKALRLGYDHMAPRFTRERLLAKGINVFRQAAREKLYFGYAHPHPPSRPLISIMAECAGLEIFDNQLECATPMISEEFRSLVSQFTRPYIVIQPHASDWTPNKEWPAGYWSELVKSLVVDFDVVEAGTRAVIGTDFQHPRFHGFAGRTSVSELLFLISQAALYIGPDSGGMHVAQAFQVPTVIIFGGYSLPESFQYPRMTPLSGSVNCSPCWLTTPCPYQTKCLQMISPAQVSKVVRQALESH